MALKLNDFMSEIRSLGVQRPTRYRFDMEPPSTMQLGGSGLLGFAGDFLGMARTRQLSLRCYSVGFPGVTLMTKDDILRYGYGPVDKTAHGAMFSDIGVSFIADRDGTLQQFFHKWQRSVVNFDSEDGMDNDYQGAASYEVEYKDKYTSLIEIHQMDEQNKTMLSLKAWQAFPIHVGDVVLQADANDQFLILPVTFSYRDHKIKRKSNISDKVINLF